MTLFEPPVQEPSITQPGSLKSSWEREDLGWEAKAQPSRALPHNIHRRLSILCF